MIETNTQRSQAAVRAPVCDMEIDPAESVATRIFGEETLYFCSERCVQQFDREHTGSATTGVSATETLRRIELSVADFDGRQGAKRLEEQLKTLPGVRQATANSRAKLIRIDYDPSQIQVEKSLSKPERLAICLGWRAPNWISRVVMHCASCVLTIEQALQQTPGVLEATVNLATQQAHIEYVPGLIERKGLAHAVEAAGYQVRENRLPPRRCLIVPTRIGHMSIQH